MKMPPPPSIGVLRMMVAMTKVTASVSSAKQLAAQATQAKDDGADADRQQRRQDRGQAAG